MFSISSSSPYSSFNRLSYTEKADDVAPRNPVLPTPVMSILGAAAIGVTTLYSRKGSTEDAQSFFFRLYQLGKLDLKPCSYFLQRFNNRQPLNHPETGSLSGLDDRFKQVLSFLSNQGESAYVTDILKRVSGDQPARSPWFEAIILSRLKQKHGTALTLNPNISSETASMHPDALLEKDGLRILIETKLFNYESDSDRLKPALEKMAQQAAAYAKNISNNSHQGLIFYIQVRDDATRAQAHKTISKVFDRIPDRFCIFFIPHTDPRFPTYDDFVRL